VFQRYVAIGDSTTEGLDDPDGQGGYRGWANRLAEQLARGQPGLLYANLAVRGRVTRQIRDGQLAPALAMRPDLATVVAGVNDLLRARFELAAYRADMEAMFGALVEAGATVLTFTMPDLTPVMPLARPLRGRLGQMNRALQQAASATGAVLVDFAAHPVASDPRLWSDDRLHANALGHARVAAALADALHLPGADGGWRASLPAPPPRSAAAALGAELAWARAHLLPWLGRHLRGRSSGDARVAKRPELAPVEPGNA
jgi:lysophospholipase L1-like esterase